MSRAKPGHGEGRGEPRRWSIPAAILRGAGETIGNLDILAEHEPDLAVLLWRTVRDVELLAGTPPALRRDLFGPRAPQNRSAMLHQVDLPDDIAGALDTLNALLANPPQAEDEIVAACAERVACWAREAAAPATALGYAQAAALVVPQESHPAYLTGLAAEAAGQRDRAESWYRRAIGVARRARQRDAYTRAYLALAELVQGGTHPQLARAHYLRVVRAARRAGLRDEGSRAAYGLFRLALARGDIGEIATYARMAGRPPGRESSTPPPYGIDLPRYWIEAGEPRRALRLLRRLGAPDQPPRVRIAAALTRIRAHVSAGERPAAVTAWRRAREHARQLALPVPELVDALVELARTAASLRLPHESQDAARAALAATPDDDYLRIRDELAGLHPLPAPPRPHDP